MCFIAKQDFMFTRLYGKNNVFLIRQIITQQGNKQV